MEQRFRRCLWRRISILDFRRSVIADACPESEGKGNGENHPDTPELLLHRRESFLRTLYNQRIRPHLDYGMAACPPGTSAEAKKTLEAIQSKATALVHGLKTRNAEERRKALGLMTLQQRRERGDLMEVFKILNGMTRIDPAAFWEIRPARNGTRWVKERATKGKSRPKASNGQQFPCPAKL